MDNQHRKISGYRELTQEEIDLMNDIKAKGKELQDLVNKCNEFDLTAPGFTNDQINDAGRWRSIARTHLQQGLMALTRSVAKPEFF